MHILGSPRDYGLLASVRFKGEPSPQVVSTTQSTKTDPWSAVQGYLRGSAGEGLRVSPGQGDPLSGTAGGPITIPGLYQMAYERYAQPGPSFFPGQTYANFDPLQVQAQDRTAQIAQAGNPALNATQNTAAGYAAGDFSNPAIQGALNATRRSVQPGIDSRFMQSGRTWSPAHAQSLGQGISDATAPIIFGAQQNAMQQAPGLATAAYTDPSMLASVGAGRQAQAQLGVQEDLQRHQFEQTIPDMKLQQYQSLLGGIPTGGVSTGTAQQPIMGGGGKGNPMGSIGGMMGGLGNLGQGLGGMGVKF